MAVVSSVGQVMMLSVGSSIEQRAKTSNKRVSIHIIPSSTQEMLIFKVENTDASHGASKTTFLSKFEKWVELAIVIERHQLKCFPHFFCQAVKTYTRRGRGRCPTPSCSFVYVTRHKPPTCPDCGGHLGGKWMPAVSDKQCLHLNI